MTGILQFIVGLMLIGTVYFVTVCVVQVAYDMIHWWRNRK